MYIPYSPVGKVAENMPHIARLYKVFKPQISVKCMDTYTVCVIATEMLNTTFMMKFMMVERQTQDTVFICESVFR